MLWLYPSWFPAPIAAEVGQTETCLELGLRWPRVGRLLGKVGKVLGIFGSGLGVVFGRVYWTIPFHGKS